MRSKLQFPAIPLKVFLLLFLAGWIVNASTTSATLTAPAADPDINTGQTFTLSVLVSCAVPGSGNCGPIVVYPRYCTGAACTPNADITTVSSGLTSNVNSQTIASMARGTTQTLSFTITGAASNVYVVGARFTSDNPATGTAAGTQTVTVLSPAALTATLSAVPTVVSHGQTITVTMGVTNTGQRGANSVTPSALTVIPIGTASATYATGPIPANAPIAGGGNQDYVWTYTAVEGSGGTVAFSGDAAGTDAKTGAAVTSNTATSNAVTVVFIETTFTHASIDFGDVDDGTTNNPAAGNGAYVFTNTANSNTAVHAYLQATDMQDGTLTYTIPVANLKVSQDADRLVKFVSLVKSGGTPQWLDSDAASDGYIDALAAGATQNLWFWLDVPALQTGADYTGSLTLKSVAPGFAP